MNCFLKYVMFELIFISLFFDDFVISEDRKNEEIKIRKKRQFFGGYGSFVGISVPFFGMHWGCFDSYLFPHMWSYGPPFFGYGSPFFGYGPMFYG
ncbi:Mitochondrial thiamine pyrophosphate carrier [Dirofilaria immitis]